MLEQAKDIQKRLQRVMFVLLQHELDSSNFEQLQVHHPELRGMTVDEVQAFVASALRKGARKS